MTDIAYCPAEQAPEQERARPGERIGRAADVLIASVALLVLSPVMLLIALAIVAECGRPVFFSQTRLGQGGRTFRIHKFRKFQTREEVAGPLLTVRNDPRMSRVGRLLERSKLDEVPQFFNVLKGEMAIVGPRPDSAVAFDLLTGEYRAILDYKPGIFGPAQVAFRSAGELYPTNVHPHSFYLQEIFPAKARLDLAYYPRRTLAGDLMWMIRGVLAVFRLQPRLRRLPSTAARRSLPDEEHCLGIGGTDPILTVAGGAVSVLDAQSGGCADRGRTTGRQAVSRR